jgi:hypothetical protein
VYKYLEDYSNALEGFQRAATLDPEWETPTEEIRMILETTSRAQSLIQNKVQYINKLIEFCQVQNVQPHSV